MLSENIVNQIGDLIKNNQKFLLHFHPNPDPDSVGSALATALALKGLGKEVTVIGGDSPLPDFLEYLPGKELVVAKNYFDLDLNNFEVFLILDSGGLDRVSRKGEVVFPAHLRTVVIDHHVSNPGFAEINIVDASYPATCQILFDLFIAWQIVITADIAKNLFLGIYTDTGGFSHDNVSADTLAVAAALAKIAPDFPKTLFNLMNNDEPQTLVYEKLMLNSLEPVCGGKAAIVGIDQDTLVKNNITANHIHRNMANRVIAIKKFNIGVMLVGLLPGEIKVSFRTRDSKRFDVSKIAAALGGGGHKGAAAANVPGTLAEVKTKVSALLPELYPELA